MAKLHHVCYDTHCKDELRDCGYNPCLGQQLLCDLVLVLPKSIVQAEKSCLPTSNTKKNRLHTQAITKVDGYDWIQPITRLPLSTTAFAAWILGRSPPYRHNYPTFSCGCPPIDLAVPPYPRTSLRFLRNSGGPVDRYNRISALTHCSGGQGEWVILPPSPVLAAKHRMLSPDDGALLKAI